MSRLLVPLLCAAVLAPLTACQAHSRAGLQVVVSAYPLAFVAERVLGGHGSVTNLTSPGQEPHDLELTIRDTAALEDSDVAIYLAGFQPAVDEAVDNVDPRRVVEAGEVVGLRGPDDEPDPHFWLDPSKLSLLTAEVASVLADVDPARAADYRSNGRRLEQQLSRLDEDYTEGLADCSRRTVVVTHEAYDYLERYGLDFVAVVGRSPDAEPAPQHLAAVQDLIRDEGVTTVFSEALGTTSYADSLARDLGLRSAVLDPVEGLSDETADKSYLSIMRDNLRVLEEAGECS